MCSLSLNIQSQVWSNRNQNLKWAATPESGKMKAKMVSSQHFRPSKLKKLMISHPASEWINRHVCRSVCRSFCPSVIQSTILYYTIYTIFLYYFYIYIYKHACQKKTNEVGKEQSSSLFFPVLCFSIHVNSLCSLHLHFCFDFEEGITESVTFSSYLHFVAISRTVCVNSNRWSPSSDPV